MIAFATIAVIMWMVTGSLLRRLPRGFWYASLIILITWIIAPVVGAIVGTGFGIATQDRDMPAAIVQGIIYGMFFMVLSPFIVVYDRRTPAQRDVMNAS